MAASRTLAFAIEMVFRTGVTLVFFREVGIAVVSLAFPVVLYERDLVTIRAKFFHMSFSFISLFSCDCTGGEFYLSLCWSRVLPVEGCDFHFVSDGVRG